MITLTARIAILSAAALAVAACTSIRIEPLPALEPGPADVGSLLVGAARTNLDPPLGYAMGGHGINGAVAVGRWNELSVRTIAITDKHGDSVFLVAVDAWSVSQGLVARILETLRQRRDLQFIRADQLIVSATHSHHTPGHVATSPVYNHFAQALPGFDQALFDLLAERIANSIGRAWDARVPARIELRHGDLGGLARNRSLEAFLLNPGMGNVTSPESRQATDPRLRSIWAYSVDNDVVAVFALVPIHPVAMPARTPVYHPDFFGVASRELEAELTTERRTAVVAIVNGAEGDQSPTWQWQGLPEAVRLGRELARRIKDSGPDTALDPRLRTANMQFRLAGARLADSGRVAPFPMSGAAQLGGAEDGRTELHETLWFREGARRQFLRVPWHGAKQPILPVVWPLVNLAYPVPKSVPLNVVHIDEHFVLVSLPGEFTTYLGKSIEAHIIDNTAIERVWPVGLTNAYLSYFTTPEEYSAQHYEGGSSLYGPLAGIAIRNELLGLTDSDATAEYPVRFRTGRKLRDERDYPEVPRAECCDAAGQLTTNCPAMALLGIPDAFSAHCTDPDTPGRPSQEDVHFFSSGGQAWVLRVTVP